MRLLTRGRLARISGFAITQVVVQGMGFVAGIFLVHRLDPAQYGLYTLAVSMTGIATILADLGVSTAVLSLGGPIAGTRPALRALMNDALRLHRRLLVVAALVLVPGSVALLMNQHAGAWQAALLAVIVMGTAACGVAIAIRLSIARLLGRTRLQQSLDLGSNAARLGLLVLASTLFLDATVACAVALAVALVHAACLHRALFSSVDEPPCEAAGHTPALRALLGRLAPNSLYYVVASQLALWLIGIFGSAERVAEVGALSRLGAIFVVIGSVSAALLLPYFARHDEPADLGSAFIGVNVFYAGMLAMLLAVSTAFPGALLWVLGSRYATLEGELPWMVAATTLAAWSGTIYSVGCARGWVMPVRLVGAVGLGATVVAAALVDVSTVRGTFMIYTASGAAGTVAAVAYFSAQLHRHARVRVVMP